MFGGDRLLVADIEEERILSLQGNPALFNFAHLGSDSLRTPETGVGRKHGDRREVSRSENSRSSLGKRVRLVEYQDTSRLSRVLARLRFGMSFVNVYMNRIFIPSNAKKVKTVWIWWDNFCYRKQPTGTCPALKNYLAPRRVIQKLAVLVAK